MKYVSPANAITLQSMQNTMVHCCLVQTQGAQKYGFTEYDTQLVIDAVTYSPGGFGLSTLDSGSNLAVANIQGAGPYTSDITFDSIRRGVFDAATIEVFLVNPLSVSDGKIFLTKGYVSDCTLNEFNLTFQFDDMRILLGRKITIELSPNCDAVLGDTRCGYSLSGVTFSAAISAVSDQYQMTASSLSNPDNYFNNGLMISTSGSNSGFSRDIKSHASDTVILHKRFPFNVQIGDTFQFVRGCAKTLEACNDTFNNIVNFRGQPFVTGNRFLGESA